MQEYFKLLGCRAEDCVTGWSGVVTSISFDLYGCIQGLIVPPQPKDAKEWKDARWFDLKRIVAIDTDPIMALPDFVKIPGGQDLPQYSDD